MTYVCDVLHAVLHVCVCCFVVCGCAVSRRYIDVCYCDMFSVVNVYLDHLKFCVVRINCRRYVCCSECDVEGELGLLKCDDICMCVVNKQFELLEFVSESIYVDLIYLTFTAEPVCLCGVSNPVLVLGLFVRLS